MRKGHRALSVLPAALLTCALSASAAEFDDFIATETYFVPLPEEQVREILAALDPGPDSATSTTIDTVVSIAVSLPGVMIVYDQFEDGYEVDIGNPTDVFPVGTTEIWGDDNPANGIPPGFTDDIIGVRDIIVLRNLVPTPVSSTGRLYNARDKFAINVPAAVTRAAWAPEPGTLLAGAVEVFPTSEWGSEFEAPLGEDVSSDEMFELVTVSYMAAQDGTTIEFDNDLDGVFGVADADEIPPYVELDQGGSFVAPIIGDVLAGARARTLDGKPVQAHVITGDLPTGSAPARFESRWAVALPTSLWGTEYFVPVSSGADDPTDVFVFNPGPNTITVSCDVQIGLSCTDIVGAALASAPVSDNGVVRFRLPNGSGARFSSAGVDNTFYAIATVDSSSPNSDDAEDATNGVENNRDFDWGVALIPTRELSTQVLAPFAPAIDPTDPVTGDGICSPLVAADCLPDAGFPGSPLWVVSADVTGPTRVYVDFDGDPASGPLTDSEGNQYDQLIELEPLERARVFDEMDNDNTGTVLYTLDDASGPAELLAVAWGQDPENSVPGRPYFDAGTYVAGQATLTIVKDVDQSLVERGDELTYTIMVINSSRGTVPQVTVSDELPAGVSYVPDSTQVDGVDFMRPDGGVFPLAGAGALIGSVPPTSVTDVTFNVTVNDDVLPSVDPDGLCVPVEQTALLNNAVVTSVTGFRSEDDALSCVDFAPQFTIVKLTNGQDANDPDLADVPVIAPGDTVIWTYLVENTGEIAIAEGDLELTDNIPGTIPARILPDSAGDNDASLEPGEVWTFEATGLALDLSLPGGPGLQLIEGVCTLDGTRDPSTAYTNVGTASVGEVSVSDPSSYCNPPPPPPAGGEGCTPGYWKNLRKHGDEWTAPYDPSDLFSSVFADAFAGKDLEDVLRQGGGGLKALGRHTVAALLNAASTDVSYALTTQDVITQFNVLIADVGLGAGNSAYNGLKDEFQTFNEEGCPLN